MEFAKRLGHHWVIHRLEMRAALRCMAGQTRYALFVRDERDCVSRPIKATRAHNLATITASGFVGRFKGRCTIGTVERLRAARWARLDIGVSNERPSFVGKVIVENTARVGGDIRFKKNRDGDMTAKFGRRLCGDEVHRG